METVVFRSDIARLVLRYLQDQRLDRVSKLFCKSSPFLRQEFSAYKHGFCGHSFFPALEEIICEYVKIAQSVEKILNTLPIGDTAKLRELSLSEKVNEVLQSERLFGENQKNQNENEENTSPADTSESFERYQEVSTKKCTTTKRKRRKSTSSEWSSDVRPICKKRRFSQRFCFLVGTQKNRCVKKIQCSTPDSSDSDLHGEECKDNANDATIDETDLSKLDMPKSESTPLHKLPKAKTIAKVLPEITHAILDNEEFQKKLVNNINLALQSAEIRTCNNVQSIASFANQSDNQQKMIAEQTEAHQIISSNQLLDEMVRNILEATEQDPTFDAIIQEVVGGSNKDVAEEAPCDALSTPITALSKHQLGVPLKTTTSTSIAPPNLIATTQNVPPRTPLIIRHAVAAGAAAGCTSTQGEQQNTLGQIIHHGGAPNNNNSFSVLMDPSFSISKLVVMNSNESTLKHYPQVEQTGISIGNTTCEQILSQLGSAPEPQADEQVFFDVSTGQLAFPLYVINEGITSSMPFVTNNEASVITTNVVANRITTPIVMSTNAVENPAEKALKPIEPTKSEAIIKPLEELTSDHHCVVSKVINRPNFLNPAQPLEGVTPSTSGVINTKTSKSLSTPRKRASHVRTLSFSPANSAAPITSSGATPLSTRRQLPASRICDISILTEEEEQKISESLVLEKPVIRNVEILPKLPLNSSITATIITNESSNSCSVPPLFAAEETSNQTVIKTELSLMEKGSCSSAEIIKSKMDSITDNTISDNTPKRKQSRRTAVRRCKRQLSKSSNEEKHDTATEEPAIDKQSDENKQPINESNIESNVQSTQKNQEIVQKLQTKLDRKAEISIEEWKKLRSGTNNDLDARLRAINAQRFDLAPRTTKRDTKRKTRSKRGRRATSCRSKIEKQKKTTEILEILSTPEKEGEGENEILDKKTQEPETSPKTEKELPKPSDETGTNNQTIISNEVPSSRPSKDPLLAEPSSSEKVSVTSEAEKRTANIGYLLETPFKDNNTPSGFVPPTPGVFLPTLDTPISKLKIQDDLLESASYLFGSLSKSELGTPLLNAITPGIRFTPLVAKDTATPLSVATTECSSGGSYYRPDESEDLDRNIEKMLRDSAQKRRIEGNQQDNLGMTPAQTSDAADLNEPTEMDICVEIPVETLKVAPIVLKRVKSFGADDTETLNNRPPTTSATIDPHYILASGLPEICAEKEENEAPISVSASSTSSSSSSSSTSSSSSSSSSSSESSSSESETEHSSKKPTTHSQKKLCANTSQTSTKAEIFLKNVSDISSCEDEDWEKLETNKDAVASYNDENSQLVGNDGEVRYPVRSWLTPRKEQVTINQATIKMTLKSAEKCGRNSITEQRSIDLELKRERMKEKLRQAETPMSKAKYGRTNATKPQVRRRQPTRKFSSQSPSVTEKDKATVDVLTALNLSAKKQPPTDIVLSVDIAKSPLKIQLQPGDADDNATSNVFESSKRILKEKPDATRVISTTAISTSTGLQTLLAAKTNVVQRKCLQIEALPAINSSRATSKTKQIVRTPLGFKSSSGATVKDATTPNKNSTTKPSPKAKIKIPAQASSSTGADRIEKKRASPRLKKAEPVTKKTGVTKVSRTPTKTTKRTTTANKKQQKEVLEKIKENKRLLTLLEPISEKKTETLATNKEYNPPGTAVKELQTKTIKNTAAEILKSNKEKQINNAKKSSESKSPKNVENSIQPAERKIPDFGIDDIEDDPLEDCVCVSITENDRKHFFTHVHGETTDRSRMNVINPASISEHLKKFTMNVAIDANVTHTWRISEEYCLFSCEPTNSPALLIRNIPKKRKIRITSSSMSCDEDDSSKKQGEPNRTSLLTKNDFRKCQPESITKDQIELSVVKSPRQDEMNVSLTDSNPTDKLEIEDIESILSHIHGAERL